MSFYPLLRRVSGLAVSLFYGKVTVNGADRVPSGGLLVVAGPHANHMQDSVIIGYALGRDDVHFLAYSTLYKGMLVGPILKRIDDAELGKKLERFEDSIRLPFLRTLNLIPVNRVKDGKDKFSDFEENYLVLLEEAAAQVAQGHVVVIYPDGGSPAGYTLGHLQAGAGQLAVSLAKQVGGKASVICAGINYSGFYEPFQSQVTVSFGEPTSLGDFAGVDTKAAMRKLRKALTAQFDREIRQLSVVAPINDPQRIEQIAPLLSGLNLDDITRVRMAADAVSRIENLAEGERDTVLSELDQFYSVLDADWGIPGRLAADTLMPWTVKSSLVDWAMVFMVYLGIALNGLPLALLAQRTQQMPEFLYMRGQQFFGTAIAIFLGWYGALLGVLGIEATFDPSLVLPTFAGVSVSVITGAIAARGYFEANSHLFRRLDPFRYAVVVAMRTVLQETILEIVDHGEGGNQG